MKITVESTKAFSYGAVDETRGVVDVVRVQWQKEPGARRVGVNIVSDATAPQDMLRAAASYFDEPISAI